MSNQLNYPGDVTDIDTTTLMGPDMFGAYYQPVIAVYDKASNRTVVQFRPVPPGELPDHLRRH